MTKTTATSLKDLDRISLKRAVSVEGRTALPPGASGTIVAILDEDVAFLVEFTKPFAALVEIDVNELDAVSEPLVDHPAG